MTTENSSIQKFKYKRVMIIDDNEVDRYVCDRVSKVYNFSELVIGQESALEAIEFLVSLKDFPNELPEVIFLDINMPEMNGFEFLDVYETLPDVIRKTCIIVMLTSSADPKDIERVKGNKYVCGYINKPFSKEKIEQLSIT